MFRGWRGEVIGETGSVNKKRGVVVYHQITSTKQKTRKRRKKRLVNLQESKLQVTVDLGLEGDFNVQVQVQSQTEGIALATAAAAALLVDGLAGHSAEDSGSAVDEPAGGVLDSAEGQVVEGTGARLTAAVLLASSLGRGVVLRLLALGLVDLLGLLLLPLGLLLV